MDEGDRPDPGIGGASGAMFAQAAFHHGQENAQHRALQGCVARKEVAQPFGHGEYPLRTGSGGKTWSTRCAAVSAMRRVLQEGHTPRHLQEYAIRKSCWHSSQ